MCFTCRGRGHYARDCTVKLCSRCHEKGHDSSCPSPANMESALANEMPHQGDGVIAAALFVATELDVMAVGLRYMAISTGPLWHQASLLVAVPLVMERGSRWNCGLGKSASRLRLGVSAPGRLATCHRVARK